MKPSLLCHAKIATFDLRAELTSYVIAGRWHSLGVLILSTESYENRIIPPGLSPALSSTFGLPDNLNSNHSLSATA